MKRIIAFLMAFLLFAAQGAAECACPDAEEHARRQAIVDRVLAGYETMGASVAVISHGQVVDTFVYGRANRADNMPVTEETYFKIASVTKMISALGVMRLVENHTMELDADISDYLPYTVRNPYYPDTPITLRQIMTHTATLADGYHYKEATDYGRITPLSIVFEGNYRKQNFIAKQPGTVSDYSNFGGGMLGVFMEELSGMPVDEYMQTYIFQPLGVTAAYHTPNLPADAQIARIYNTETTGMTLDMMASDETHWFAEPELDYVHTAGGLMCTAEGLARLLICIIGDGTYNGARILRPETVEAMRTMQNNVGSVACDSNRGLNMNILTDVLVPGRTMYGHQGKAYGMIAAAYGDPTDQTGVVMITNGCNDSTFNSVARIARALLSAIYEGWLDEPQAYRLAQPAPTPELGPAPTAAPPLPSEPVPASTPAPTEEPLPEFEGDLIIRPADWLFEEDNSSEWTESETDELPAAVF